MSATTVNGHDPWITYVGHAGAFTLPLDDDEGELEEELIERQDWEALTTLRRRQVDECPCGLCSAGLAEALIAAGRYDEALGVLTTAEEELPGDPLVTELALNALHLLGRDLLDFPWSVAPRIFRLGSRALELCREHLERTGRAQTVGSLRQELFADAYIDFDSGRLADALGSDGRFAVGRDDMGRTTVRLR
jgi:hypothetical protein